MYDLTQIVKKLSGKQFKQAQIADMLDIDQATVSRHLAKSEVVLGWEDDPMLLCPLCAYDCVHIDSVTHNDTSKKFRGDEVVVTFWCESCVKKMDLLMSQHKGRTYLTIDNVRDYESAPPPTTPRT